MDDESESIAALRRKLETADRAIQNAAYLLDPNQGERPDPAEAYKWLRTTYPPTHANYVDPESLAAGLADRVW